MMSDSIVNCTSHIVVVKMGENMSLAIAPSGQVARVHSEKLRCGSINGIPLIKTATIAIDLPKPRRGVRCIVSSMVAEAFPKRKDLLVPGGKINDEHGVVACNYFITR